MIVWLFFLGTFWLTACHVSRPIPAPPYQQFWTEPRLSTSQATRACQQQDHYFSRLQKNNASKNKLLRFYRKKMLEFPHSAHWCFLYGRLLGLLHKPEESVYFFRLAAQKDPEFIWAYQGLGLYHLKNNNPQRAQEHFQKALALHSSFVPAHVALAKAFASSQLPKSLFHLYWAVALKPKAAPLRWHLANVLILQRREPEALAELQQAVNLAPENIQFLQDLAALQIQQKKYQDAYQTIGRALPHIADRKLRQRLQAILSHLQNIEEYEETP